MIQILIILLVLILIYTDTDTQTLLDKWMSSLIFFLAAVQLLLLKDALLMLLEVQLWWFSFHSRHQGFLITDGMIDPGPSKLKKKKICQHIIILIV